MNTTQDIRKSERIIKEFGDPPVTKALFSEVRWSWIWLILRLYAGYEWLSAGWSKLQSPVWTGSKAGTAITGFIQNALTKATGQHPDVQASNAWFLQNVVLTHSRFWSYLVSWGEFLVGVALIVGIFTGIAAFFGAFMNMNYLLAGTVSTNPILLIIAILLVLAWKVAGWWGLDRFILPTLGTPWKPGVIFQTTSEKSSQTAIQNPGKV